MNAKSYSEECSCDGASSYADDGYTEADRGYKSSDWDDTKDYARKAEGNAEDAMSAAEECDNQQLRSVQK